MIKSFTAGLLALMGSAILCPAQAQTGNYLDEVRSDYPTILVSGIESGEVLRTSPGALCFYKYEARVLSVIKGHYKQADFVFFSESKLSIGADYLIYFSEIDARKYRILQVYASAQISPACRVFMNGFLLLDTETHRMRDVWDGKKIRSVVEFSDPAADSISDQGITQTRRLIDFDYVRSELAK